MKKAVFPTTPVPPPKVLLQYLSAYKVIVCTTCKYAIQPKAIARHLKEIHRIERADRQPFMKYVQKFELAEQELVVNYRPHVFPVPLLPVQRGLECKSEACDYLCVTEKRMRNHWPSAHGRQGLAACDWRAARLQTFFRGNLLRYFTDRSSGEYDEKSTVQVLTQRTPNEQTRQLPDVDSSSMSLSKAIFKSNQQIFHHYTTQTWRAFANDKDTQHMWQVVVPQLASQHEYLMHALLACTALHMAHMDPEQRPELTLKARVHQDQAFPSFRAAVPHVESETSDAIIVFARLVTIAAFALDERTEMGEATEDTLPSWLFFVRSGCTMLCDVWDQIGSGPVRYLAGSWETLVERSKVPHQLLLDFFLSIPSEDWPNEVRKPYSQSATVLAQNFSYIHELDEKVAMMDVVRFWPIQNSVEYLDMLSAWHPGALVLLAYYCVVLHRAGTNNWYLQGRAASMLSTIVRHLDASWYRHIRWPLDEVGLSSSVKENTDGLSIASLTLDENKCEGVHG